MVRPKAHSKSHTDTFTPPNYPYSPESYTPTQKEYRENAEQRKHSPRRRDRLPSRGGVLAGGSQAMHSPVWIEALTLRLPDDTAPVELNAHPQICMI